MPIRYQDYALHRIDYQVFGGTTRQVPKQWELD